MQPSSYNEPPTTPFISPPEPGTTSLFSRLVARLRSSKRLLLIVAVAVVVVITAVILVVIGLGGKGDKNRQPAVAISPIVANVSIQSSGYTPQTIKIKVGQEITWTSQDTTPRSLTADQSSLPGFGTTEPLSQGDSYSYIFEKAGTYHYYDPLDPKTFVGIVTVQ